MASELQNLALARSLLDRAAHLRTSDQTLDELFANAKIFQVNQGKFIWSDGASQPEQATQPSQNKSASSAGGLIYLDPNSTVIKSPEFAASVAERFFLGLAPNGQPFFAINAPFPEGTENLVSLRDVGTLLSDLEIGAVMHAVALANWHDVHPRCARCGEPTISILGGSTRKCPACEAEHYPRTDSAVIVLVRDREDRILLGRQKIWPAKRFSTFAGFLEPGETFEQCVEREVFEEAGVKVSQMQYLGSQPWPFPASIMIAFSAVVEDPSTAKADGVEITEVRWFSRDDLKKSIADGSLLLPPTISVARKMIAMWFGPGADKLTGGESWR
jgi:NAD+ diphosphatase